MVVTQMQCVSLTNKTTLKRKKILSVYELPSKLINFYILANAGTVNVFPCDAPLQGSSAMALDARCASKGSMQEMLMSERGKVKRGDVIRATSVLRRKDPSLLPQHTPRKPFQHPHLEYLKLHHTAPNTLTTHRLPNTWVPRSNHRTPRW